MMTSWVHKSSAAESTSLQLLSPRVFSRWVHKSSAAESTRLQLLSPRVFSCWVHKSSAAESTSPQLLSPRVFSCWVYVSSAGDSLSSDRQSAHRASPCSPAHHSSISAQLTSVQHYSIPFCQCLLPLLITSVQTHYAQCNTQGFAPIDPSISTFLSSLSSSFPSFLPSHSGVCNHADLTQWVVRQPVCRCHVTPAVAKPDQSVYCCCGW